MTGAGGRGWHYDDAGLARAAAAMAARDGEEGVERARAAVEGAARGSRGEARRARFAGVLFLAILGFACRGLLSDGSSFAAASLAARSSDMQQTKAGVVAALVAVAVSGAASAQEAVEWRVEDGGNGHWYAVMLNSAGWTWSLAAAAATHIGGALVSCETGGELNFVLQRFSEINAPDVWRVQSINSEALMGPWVGAYQAVGAEEPNGGWTWLTGVQFDPQDGSNCCNNDCIGNQEDRLHLYARQSTGWTTALNDLTDNPKACSDLLLGAVVEWSADCNADGIVDFGQIRAGALEDLNGNNIPDCCEDGSSCAPCVADVIEDGDVNGVDLAAVINAWGTDGGKLPRTDIDRNGIIDGADLAILLSAWGACD